MVPEKKRILVVDDAEINRSLLTDMLGNQYDILEACNGREAIDIIEKEYKTLSLILLDIVMPDIDGFQVLEVIQTKGWNENIPVIIISSETAAHYINRAYALGATEYISRPFDESTVRRRVKNMIMLYSKQKMLESMVSEQIMEKEHSNKVMIDILSNIVEFRNGDSGEHVVNIRTLTELLLNKLVRITDRYPLTQKDITLIANASSLHDIGKISIPESILNKPAKLTPEEFTIIKTHSAIGAQILEKVPHHQGEKLIKIARAICRWHHERYDGKGYPDGLVGENIPIEAQVVALADVYDALTHARVYKKPYSHDEALKMIQNGECGAFNPLLLQCLVEVSPQITSKIRASLKAEEERVNKNALVPDSLFNEKVSGRTLALLEQEREKYRFFAMMSNEIQFEYDEKSDILTLSEWGAAHMKVGAIISHPGSNEEFTKILSAKDYYDIHYKLRRATVENSVVSGMYLLTIDGQPRWHKLVARPLWIAGELFEMTGTIGKFVDVHEEFMRLANFKHQAQCDSLTKLHNHVTASKSIKAALRKKGHKYALIIIDLDHFKEANDTYGHQFGDAVLRHVANKILKCLDSPESVAARIGGDEFMIFIPYDDLIETIVDGVFTSISGNYQNFNIALSMGIVCAPEYGVDYNKLFYCADKALYMAKQRGRNRYCFYDQSIKGNLSVLSPIETKIF